jgi:hypothetical protein
MKVTRHFGQPERVDINEVEIPDLWHLAMFVKDHEEEINKRVGHNHLVTDAIFKYGNASKAMLWSEAILETWGIAHDLKKNIIENLIKEE